MRYFNLFYLAVIILGVVLFSLLRPDFHRDLSFYGFAESTQSEINYNYPVVVERILVKPGEAVQAGQDLLLLTRRKAKETMEDQSFKIAELKAEEAIWRQRKQNEISALEMKRTNELAELQNKIEQTEKELAYKKSLSQNLQTITTPASSYSPLQEKLAEWQKQLVALRQSYESRLQGLNKELALGNNPYREQIKRLSAELGFEQAQKLQQITVKAPTAGLIGNMFCKEAEHIPSYKTLLTFYEPHSSTIKGYVHEELTLKVQIGDEFCISSLKDENISYPGKVTGLGSRIVEIPTRLRKIAEIKSYGREVLIEIPEENIFLQKEKVSISFIPKED